ncbi:hypothetical protein HF313_15110 [Massilia atriviolacea]|uniref:Uncharacterized protein n=1 Tax=Massilia atriviolacea TaxID=2495579 RepID=A0A430HR90_9BURK|nr:hypothetical protein [Massilia atriviolacea]RSZ60041.1 hypothetical protein EJB06_07630 [Massilia atriviolacea]
MDEEFYASSRRLVQVSFYADGTWVAPMTTTSVDMLGRGQDGSPGGTTATSVVVAVVTWLIGTGGPNPGVATWDNAQAAASAAASAINAGAGSWTEYQVAQYSGGTYILNTTVRSGPSLAGSASVSYQAGWQPSGPITGGAMPGSPQQWTATVNYSYTASGATVGANATGLGKTFLGGVGDYATPVAYPGVAVTPGASYPIVAPLGSIITLTYFE